MPPIDPKPVNPVNVQVAPIIPSGMPATDPAKPAWALTQEQIDFIWNTAVGYWPAFKQYWGILLVIAAGFGIVGRSTAPSNPPVNVNIASPNDGSVSSPIMNPVADKRRIKVFLIDKANIMADPKLKDIPVTIDPAIYKSTQVYPFAGKEVQLPCFEYTDKTGKIVDVQHFSSTDEIVQYWKKAGSQ